MTMLVDSIRNYSRKYAEKNAEARKTVHPENFPQYLRESALFNLWRYEDRDGKPSKVPKHPLSGENGKSTDKRTFTRWTTLERIWKNYSDSFAGIGIGIFGDIGAIDIDHCIDKDGNLSEMAQDIVTTMDSYWEKSPSGTGIRIFFTAKGYKYDKKKYYIKFDKIGLEIYISGMTKRFVTITGNVLPGCARPVEDRADRIQTILDKYMKRKSGKSDVGMEKKPVSTPPALSDLDIVNKASNAANGVEFQRLWNGDTSAYSSVNSDGSRNDGRSEADLALCNMLAFWTGKDAGRMDSLFRQSGLMREKWDRPQAGTTYGAITIQKAIEDCNQVYDPDSKKPPDNKEPLKTFVPPDFSDVGQAIVFRDLYGDRVRYSKQTDYLVYGGIKWDEDPVKAQKLAQNLTDKQLKEAREKLTAANKKLMDAMESGDEAEKKIAEAEVKKCKAYFNYVLQRRMDGAVSHTLTQARSMLQIQVKDLDADPYLLNTPAGAVDLRAGTVRPGKPEDYCTKATAVSPSREGVDLFMEFLEKLTGGNPDLIEYLQVTAGMCAIGQVKQEKLIIANGEGGNGKSTFYNLLFRVFGDYAGTLSAESLTVGNRNGKNAELAELRGKRLIIAAELEDGTRMDTAMVKKLCSTDPIHAEKKYKDPFHFIPSHTVILYTNHLPKVGTTDNGTWRRLAVIPFSQKFSGMPGEVQNYSDYLFEHCGGAVLAWVIEGARIFVNQNYTLKEPLCVREAVNSYREENDWLAHFVEDCCDIGASFSTPASALYARYKNYCEDNSEYIRNQSDFKRALQSAGYIYKRGANSRQYIGLQLISHFQKMNNGEKIPFENGA